MMGTNSRKNKRQGCIVPVDGKQGSAFENIQAVDISRNGIGFVSDREIPLDEEIAVEIDMSENGEPVIVMGKVQWVHPIKDSDQYRVGMKFLKPV